MSGANDGYGNVMDALGGAAEERIRALISLAGPGERLEDSVLSKVLELAGGGAAGVAAGEASGRRDEVVSKEERRRLADVLTRACADPAHRAIVEAALDEEPFGRRWICAFALSRFGARTPKVLQTAIEALGEADGDVRWSAAEILCHEKSGPECRPLILDAANDSNVLRRKMALYCMRDSNVAEMPVVYDALKCGDAGVRLAALAALPKLAHREPRAVREVARCMVEDEEAGVRRAAAAILGRLRGDVETAQAALQSVAGDETDPHFQRAVARALEELTAV